MKLSPAIFVALALCLSPASRGQIHFVFDPKPDAGIPIEALHAGTVPDPQAKAGKSDEMSSSGLCRTRRITARCNKS